MQGANDAEKAGRPFTNKMDELNAQIVAARDKLNSVGLDSAGQVLAKSMGDAAMAITEVNDQLKKTHTALTSVESARIRESILARNIAESESDTYKKLVDTRDKIADQVRTQELLNAAIGRAYEIQRRVNIEIAVMKDLGAENYNQLAKQSLVQPSGMGFAVPSALAIARVKAATATDSEHVTEMSKTAESLRDQIGLQTRLAQVQAQGAAVVKLATLDYNIALMRRKGITEDVIQLEIEKWRTENSDQSAAAVAKLNDETDAVKRLSAAYLEGADAVRRAQLQNKLAVLGREGNLTVPSGLGFSVPSASATATIGGGTAERQNQISKLAGETRLQNLNQQIADLEQALAVTKDTAGIEMQLRDLDRERLQMMRDQALAQGSARDGMRAFFIEMQEQAEQTSKIVYDALNSALNDSSKNLAQMLTEKKPKGGWGQQWGKEFQSIGENVTQSGIKSIASTALGKFGAALGITSQG